MYRKVSAECVPLTPELAQRFSAMVALPGERALRSSRRSYLEVQLLRGKFSGPEWSVGRCVETGETYRLDGQHSSDLLAHLPEGAEFPADLLVTITHFEFDSLGDTADLFNLFNNPKSVRNNTDMMGTYSAQVPEFVEAGYSREFLVDVADGIFEHERTSKATDPAPIKLSARVRGLYFHMPHRPEFLAATHWLADFRERKNAHFLHRSVIMGDMIAQWFSDPGTASTFWMLVYTEGHPDPNHATRVLAEWYREQLAQTAKPKLDMEAFRKKTRKLWKLYQASEKTKSEKAEKVEAAIQQPDLLHAPA